MSVSYDYYRIFYYVAKYKSFTQAANILLSNQPNVSRAINNLENELGCRLFIRSNRGVTLTTEGQYLFSRVSAAHRQLEAAEAELADAKSLQHGIISIGVSEIALHTLLLPRLKDFHTLYPGIRVHLTSVTTTQAITSLKMGLVDFALITTPVTVRRPLKAIPLMAIHENLFGGPRFAALSKETQTIKSLPDYPIILPNSHTATREFYNHFFLDHGLSLIPEIEASVIDQILPMIKSDLGLGFLAEVFSEEAVKKREIFHIRLDCEIPARSICLVRDTSRPMNIAAKEFEKMLTKDPQPLSHQSDLPPSSK